MALYGVLLDLGPENRLIFRPACCDEHTVMSYVVNLACTGECTVTVFELDEHTGHYMEVYKT